jgi:uncharacterized protein HemX
VSADPRSRVRNLQASPARRPRGLWVPALLSTLVLATVIGGIAVGHFYWSDLRSSMGRMEETLDHARERQRQMVGHFSQAQGLLLAQQRRLQEAQEHLRAEEARLDAERAELRAAQARLALISASRASLGQRTEALDLARRLDGSLAALSDPGGLEATAETLKAVADWAAESPLLAGSPLGPALRSALVESRAMLAETQTNGPGQLARRIERLGSQATVLSPGPARPSPAHPPGGLSAGAGAGHLGEQLQTALFALHRGDEALFRLALDTAGAWLAAFYDRALPEVRAVQAELAALHRLPITQDLKPLRAGMTRLRAVLGELVQTAGTDGGTTPAPGDAEHPGEG